MQPNRVTGLTLILGALAMFGGIAAHPHHGHAEAGGERQHIIVAVIVIGSFVILGVGLSRLLRMCASRFDRDLALVVLTLAGACGTLAAVNGHVVVPRFIEGVGTDEKANPAIANVVVAHDLILSSALAQVMIAAWAISALSLSISMLRSGIVGNVIGLGGVLLGLLLLSLLVTGRFSITLHDVGLVVLASGIWLIAIGSSLFCQQADFIPEGK